MENTFMKNFNQSRFMKNWWKARLCHKCKGLHIGRKVDHNHCDFLNSDDAWARVNGRGCLNTECRHFVKKSKNPIHPTANTGG